MKYFNNPINTLHIFNNPADKYIAYLASFKNDKFNL